MPCDIHDLLTVGLNTGEIIVAADYQSIKRANARARRLDRRRAVDQSAKSVYVAARNLFLASPC
jgi:hypothetical protein